jgi:glucosamine--fructose-6-phosphate aminotransferase (isomerizing)
MNGEFTHHEILSQPAAWVEALSVVTTLKKELVAMLGSDYSQVLFTGCGSTYYLSLAAAALFQELTGRSARGVPAGELLYNPRINLAAGRTLLLAVSRSGSTTETVRAVEQFRRNGCGEVIVITNNGDQPLARLADLPIVIPAGQEQSVAQTRSFTSMFVAASAVCALAAHREDLLAAGSMLPEAGERLLREIQSDAMQMGEDLSIDRFYFLGSGIRYGLACEASLKMKEMTISHSEPFHFLEFRHGPMSMVTGSSLVVGLLSNANQPREQKVLAEMKALGGRLLGLGESDAQVAFHSCVPEEMRSILYLPFLQLMAFHRSLAKGLDPDNPVNLSSVVILD